MMAILGLCWGYVRKCKSSGGPLPTKCRLSLSARPALPTPPLKNTAFLHFYLFPASYFDMCNKPCKTQCFLYLTHTIHCKLQGLQLTGRPPVLMTRVGGGSAAGGAPVYNLRLPPKALRACHGLPGRRPDLPGYRLQPPTPKG